MESVCELHQSMTTGALNLNFHLFRCLSVINVSDKNRNLRFHSSSDFEDDLTQIQTQVKGKKVCATFLCGCNFFVFIDIIEKLDGKKLDC